MSQKTHNKPLLGQEFQPDEPPCKGKTEKLPHKNRLLQGVNRQKNTLQSTLQNAFVTVESKKKTHNSPKITGNFTAQTALKYTNFLPTSPCNKQKRGRKRPLFLFLICCFEALRLRKTQPHVAPKAGSRLHCTL